ncbi:MAG: DNA-3-methyladenine glycosylase I [Elusimicrobia bacterium]|nr:DNA-3-methyladenine glycosylase I [Elusimicrobiota bacterium]
MKNIIRCEWCGDDPVYIKYHDKEWGRLVKTDKKLFEFLTLEAAQAGLSWITILKRRANYAKAFSGFDVKKVAAYTNKDVQKLMAYEGIIRNRLKIESAISNAKLFIQVQKEFGSFRKYIESFLPNGLPVVNNWKSLSQIPARTPLSDAISADMKKREFKFFGSVICYAFLQATGYVDDHTTNCFVKNRA